jgi:hypothetical protein
MGGGKAYPHSFLISALDGDEWQLYRREIPVLLTTHSQNNNSLSTQIYLLPVSDSIWDLIPNRPHVSARASHLKVITKHYISSVSCLI